MVKDKTVEVLRQYRNRITNGEVELTKEVDDALSDAIIAIRICEATRVEFGRAYQEKQELLNQFNSTKEELNRALEEVVKYQKAYFDIQQKLCGKLASKSGYSDKLERLTVRDKYNSDIVWMKQGELKLEPCELSSKQCGILLKRLALYEDAEL